LTPSITPTLTPAPSSSPTTTPTPTPTPTPIPIIPGNFTFNADYIVVTYAFSDGTDLDTRTRITVPNIGQTSYTESIGYCCQSVWPNDGNPPILTWGGDNTGVGFESVLIDLIEFKSQYPSQNNVLIDTNAGWWGNLGTNPVFIQVILYKGGTMIKIDDAYTFTNDTYTAAYGASSDGVVVTLEFMGNCINGQNVKGLNYNLITYQGTFI
jgi:hypothetical protein